MNKCESDIYFTSSLLHGNELEDYKKIYYNSNEKINNMIRSIDINNKNVLTVLGSGDQAFHLYNNGASNVDVFDINKLTIYYYYLRRWNILYLDKYYPKYSGLKFDFNIDYIKGLIDLVVPKTEEELNALNYWKLFASKFTDYDIEFLFYLPDSNGNDLKMNNISDVSFVKEKIKNDDFKYYDYDFSWNVNLDKKYDLIYLSNIPEWIYHQQGCIHMEILMYNLFNLLNSNGIVLGTNITVKEPPESMRRIFRDCFSLKYIKDNNSLSYVGYQYKKIK